MRIEFFYTSFFSSSRSSYLYQIVNHIGCGQLCKSSSNDGVKKISISQVEILQPDLRRHDHTVGHGKEATFNNKPITFFSIAHTTWCIQFVIDWFALCHWKLWRRRRFHGRLSSSACKQSNYLDISLISRNCQHNARNAQPQARRRARAIFVYIISMSLQFNVVWSTSMIEKRRKRTHALKNLYSAISSQSIHEQIDKHKQQIRFLSVSLPH